MKNWKTVKLMDICRPKQWPTISSEQLTETGYPVYGANGIIGSYSEYTHDKETVLITCRGATCGNIHICQPYVYVTGNAMALDELSDTVDKKFLAYYLKARGLTDVISGSAQPQITRQGLTKIKFSFPPLAEQIHIAQVLDQADRLRQQDRQLLAHYDQLVQAVFMDMFGDPVRNEKRWKKEALAELAFIPSGLVDPREEYYSQLVHVGGDNIESHSGRLHSLKQAKELNLISGKFHFTPEYLLYNKIRPNLNKVASPDFEGICSADMYPIKPVKTKLTKHFLLKLLTSQDFLGYAELCSRRANIPKINREALFAYEAIVPPLELQNKFTTVATVIEAQKVTTQQLQAQSEALFNSLLQQAFRGELTRPEPAVRPAAGQLSFSM